MAYYFTLPVDTELTLDQQRAIDEPNSLALLGGPGTGKSVVSVWRHISNHSTGLRHSLLLTYTKTLEHYLRQATISEANKESDLKKKRRIFEASENINRIKWWLFQHATMSHNEIVIDEGQDIEKEVFERFFNYVENISYGADRRQGVYLSAEKQEELFNWFKTDSRFSNNVEITLGRNFRNSKEILLFTRSVFPNFMISRNTIDGAQETGLKPIMKINLGWDIKSQVDTIIDIIIDYQSDTHNIAILVPFQNMVDKFYTAIRDKLDSKIAMSKFKADDDEFNGLSGVHVTPFKSSKGTEFDTVIIPEFDRYNWVMQNGKDVTTTDYYVGFTRTKINLFLLCRNGFPNIGDRNTVTIE